MHRRRKFVCHRCSHWCRRKVSPQFEDGSWHRHIVWWFGHIFHLDKCSHFDGQLNQTNCNLHRNDMDRRIQVFHTLSDLHPIEIHLDIDNDFYIANHSHNRNYQSKSNFGLFFVCLKCICHLLNGNKANNRLCQNEGRKMHWLGKLHLGLQCKNCRKGWPNHKGR